MKKGKFGKNYIKINKILRILQTQIDTLTLTQGDYEHLRLKELRLFIKANEMVPIPYQNTWIKLDREVNDKFHIGYLLLERKAYQNNYLLEFKNWWIKLLEKETKIIHNEEREI